MQHKRVVLLIIGVVPSMISAVAAFATRSVVRRPAFLWGVHPPISSTARWFTSSTDHNDGWKTPTKIYIPEDQLDISFVRSSGAGGQNVNKVNTQVQLRFHVASASWMPTEVRERLRQQQASRVNKEGILNLHVQEHRTQTANRQAALQKLEGLVRQAWPRPKVRRLREGISDKTKRQRKEFKRKRKEVKEGRRPVRFD